MYWTRLTYTDTFLPRKNVYMSIKQLILLVKTDQKSLPPHICCVSCREKYKQNVFLRLSSHHPSIHPRLGGIYGKNKQKFVSQSSVFQKGTTLFAPQTISILLFVFVPQNGVGFEVRRYDAAKYAAVYSEGRTYEQVIGELVRKLLTYIGGNNEQG